MTPDDLDRLDELAEQLRYRAYTSDERRDALNISALVARVRELEAQHKTAAEVLRRHIPADGWAPIHHGAYALAAEVLAILHGGDAPD